MIFGWRVCLFSHHCGFSYTVKQVLAHVLVCSTSRDLIFWIVTHVSAYGFAICKFINWLKTDQGLPLFWWPFLLASSRTASALVAAWQVSQDLLFSVRKATVMWKEADSSSKDHEVWLLLTIWNKIKQDWTSLNKFKNQRPKTKK